MLQLDRSKKYSAAGKGRCRPRAAIRMDLGAGKDPEGHVQISHGASTRQLSSHRESLGSLDGPERAIRDVSPQALHHLIQVDQISPTLEHAS